MMPDYDELKKLIKNATDEGLTDGGRYFDESLTNLCECSHGDVGEYSDPDDGKLIEWLWNNRQAITDLQRENARLREALEQVQSRLSLGENEGKPETTKEWNANRAFWIAQHAVAPTEQTRKALGDTK